MPPPASGVAADRLYLPGGERLRLLDGSEHVHAPRRLVSALVPLSNMPYTLCHALSVPFRHNRVNAWKFIQVKRGDSEKGQQLRSAAVEVAIMRRKNMSGAIVHTARPLYSKLPF